MSASEPDPGDEAPGVAAGEYVLGVQDAATRAAFAARLAGDARLRREVEAWEARLSPWAEAIAPVAPPASLWERVQRALGTRETPDAVVVVLRQRLRTWRLATGASLAVAAALALAVVVPQTRPPPTLPASPPPMMMAKLMATGGEAKSAMFLAALDPDRRTLMIMPASVEAHPGRAPELWLVPHGGRPVALGMAGFGAPVRLVMASDMPAAGGAVLAVSLEPMGGSPTGQPTGPVIASGELKPV